MKKLLFFFLFLSVLQGCSKQDIKRPVYNFITVDSMEVYHGIGIHFKIAGGKLLKDTSIYRSRQCNVQLSSDKYEYAKDLLNLVTENMAVENGKYYYSACADCGQDVIVAWKDTIKYSWLIQMPCPDYINPLEEKLSSVAKVIQ